MGFTANQPTPHSTVRFDIRELTRRLNSALGGTLVAALAGASDLQLSFEWAKSGGAQPDAESVKRLRFAYEQWQIVSGAEGAQMARAWFIGVNPWLEHDTPVKAIRQGRLKEVAAAVQALVEDSFPG